ncbi:EamA family transporter [bacterium]|nr:EamA family transporter [bacterium]
MIKSINSLTSKGLRKVILLLITFVVYSCEGVLLKMASKHDFLSSLYILYFACVLLVLGLYAIMWQKILEMFPLNKVFLCKSITIVFLLFLSHFLFNEDITMNNIVGSFFIILGIVVLSWKETGGIS